MDFFERYRIAFAAALGALGCDFQASSPSPHRTIDQSVLSKNILGASDKERKKIRFFLFLRFLDDVYGKILLAQGEKPCIVSSRGDSRKIKEKHIHDL